MSVESELVKITGSPKSPEAGKTELILLSVNPLESLQDAIVSFNRENGNTRILLKAFEPDDSEPEMIRSIRKFADDELGGRFPDLLDLTGLPYEAMAAVGLLEDLTPYLNQDAELSGNILPQVLEDRVLFRGMLCRFRSWEEEGHAFSVAVRGLDEPIKLEIRTVTI